MNPFELRLQCLKMATDYYKDQGDGEFQTKQKKIFLLAAKYYTFANGDLDKIPELASSVKIHGNDRRVFFIDTGDGNEIKTVEVLDELKEDIKTRKIDTHISAEELIANRMKWVEEMKTLKSKMPTKDVPDDLE